MRRLLLAALSALCHWLPVYAAAAEPLQIEVDVYPQQRLGPISPYVFGAGIDAKTNPLRAPAHPEQALRDIADLGLRIAGANGMLHGYNSADRAVVEEATGQPYLAHITEMALFAQGPPIYGGTDQVQRNILGERALGLPKEPNDDKVKTWAELPRNG